MKRERILESTLFKRTETGPNRFQCCCTSPGRVNRQLFGCNASLCMSRYSFEADIYPWHHPETHQCDIWDDSLSLSLRSSSQVRRCPGRMAQLWTTLTGILGSWLLGKCRSPSVLSWWRETREPGILSTARPATAVLSAKLEQVSIWSQQHWKNSLTSCHTTLTFVCSIHIYIWRQYPVASKQQRRSRNSDRVTDDSLHLVFLRVWRFPRCAGSLHRCPHRSPFNHRLHRLQEEETPLLFYRPLREDV